MSFTRSANGVKNYPKFYGTSLLVYIEGKKDSTKKNKDEIYYEALLKEILGETSFKIKTVGNKEDVLEIWEKLRSKRASDSIAIVDRDLDGILASTTQPPNLVYTCGYSWENDFWCSGLLTQIIRDLTVGNRSAITDVASRQKWLSRRLSKISALDIGAQFNQETLLKKNRNSSGIGFNDEEPSLISKNEFNRVLGKFKKTGFAKCKSTREVISMALQARPENSIQGHLWENACIHLICAIYKKHTGAKAAPHEIILNLALSKFSATPRKCVSDSIFTYFDRAIKSALH